jgi:hypothetical protein
LLIFSLKHWTNHPSCICKSFLVGGERLPHTREYWNIQYSFFVTRLVLHFFVCLCSKNPELA